MRIGVIGATALLLGLGACGPAASPPAAVEEEAEALPAAGPADYPAILATLRLTADASGQIQNECGDRVTPQFLTAQLGGDAGDATLVAIPGGASMATCYGDGPDLHLFVRDGGAWREVYSARGRMLIILSTSTNGVRDLADGGPGFSFPVWTWNGRQYADANRSVADSALGDAQFLP